ncbi:serine hydrolase [Pseudohongiella sp. SYSU M77423]|uniref:serine hydrolase domain-containing protein n=1 Tax=Pseudohongiella sp. SYSU M77423 TaxID=3042312 RepID=UPI002480BADB|nr:serine hydrolase [Pseudohongiella sp. SYSU M77423]MDH7944408.1 serine hydrolase [Pseudohongiella sp. SYSU M77423]
MRNAYPGLTLLLAVGLVACSEPTETVISGSEETTSGAVDALQEATQEAASTPQMAAQEALNVEISLGSAVKRLCSSVLVGGRAIEHVMAQELSNASAAGVDFTFSIDGDLVTGAGAGQTVQALYREHLGCTLVKNTSVEVLQAQFDPALYPEKPAASDAEWPLGDSVVLPTALPGVDLDAIDAAVDQAFEDIEANQNINTRAVLVIHEGKIIAEQYAEPFNAQMPQLGWSMTKTVTAALTGMLVEEGIFDVDAPPGIPEWQSADDPRRQITLENLLQMSSGLEYSEVYTAGSMSDVILMLYTTGDTAAYAIDQPLAQEPGSTFYYSSGTTNIIARTHRQAFDGFQEYFNFPQERLFSKLGMRSAVIEPDASGTFVGSSYMYATPRDWAKIGLLYLQDGRWNGEQILPEGWVDYSVTPASSADQGQYGIQLWLNAGAPDDPADRPLPNLPANTYYLSGFEGQNVVVVPDHDLIVVRMGVTTSGPRPIWQLTESVLDAVSQGAQ